MRVSRRALAATALALATQSAPARGLELRGQGPHSLASIACGIVVGGARLAAHVTGHASIRPVPAVQVEARPMPIELAKSHPAWGRKGGTFFHGLDIQGDDDDGRFSERQKEEIRKTLHFGGGSDARNLEVDNLNGSISLVGYDGQDVQVVAYLDRAARSKEKLEESRQQIQLEITEESDLVRLYVDGPQRRDDGSIHDRGPRYYGYRVRYDFEIKVPFETDFRLRTINSGDITVERVRGAYEVENVNGGIEMREVAGPGHVYALNGEVNVLFDRNPDGESYFGSLNGDVEVAFRRNLAADVRLKTFNGEVYTDFDVTGLPGRPPVAEEEHGKRVYHHDKTFAVRIGRGGPELQFDAFNGDIRIVNRDQ